MLEMSRYCNGHAQVADGMATKKEHKIRKGKMVPNKDDITTPSSMLVDDRVKFSDKLKALLKNGASLKEEHVIDDPYTFSEPEPQALRLYQKSSVSNSYTKKCSAINRICQVTGRNSKLPVTDIGETKVKVENVKMARLFPSVTSPITDQLATGNRVTEHRGLEDENSKTISKLHTKVSHNKVVGKHKKVRSSSPCQEAVLSAKRRERSLLEEQLLGLGSDVTIKKEPNSVSCTSWHKTQATSPSQTNVIMLPSKRQQRRPLPKFLQENLDEKLQQVQVAHNSLLDYKQDLFPLGVEVSDSEESDLEEETSIFQRHWFSGCGEPGVCGTSDSEGQREGRLAQLRSEMRRKLGQMWAGMPVHHAGVLVGALVQSARTHPTQSALLLQAGRRHWRQSKHNRSKLTMLVKRVCSYRKGESDACSNLALPCTQHCVRHIMYNVDQLLYEHCTAKFSDNTQCCVPVFDVCHELPLCLEHARKRDNYDRMCAETKPKKVRKKAKPSAMTRPSKRGKKKRRMNRYSEPCSVDSSSQQLGTPSECPNPQYEHSSETDNNGGENSSPSESFETYIKEEPVEIPTPEPAVLPEAEASVPDVQVVEEEVVLSMAEELPLDPVELANQASRLLEEHDLTNVLNQIPADAFNDLFTEDKNGEYEPTREETEELERALEAVDKDVKSLEKLSQTQGLLDSLTDEHALLQTLAQLPEVPALTVPGIVPVFTSYHNGFVVNSHSSSSMDNKNMVAHSSESPSVLPYPTISIQTQTDMPS
ncbi:hypothetical protein R5R35_005283 [Gryllus longicercus]|uniref:KANL2-like probable zinc-finger domain-containing protein n=1 Tax=Gryllus longicercus TaxID=2509291 RepID=A0AAN9Z4B2_9ORTH